MGETTRGPPPDRQVRHLARLVDDLLDIARVTRGEIQIDKQQINLASVTARASPPSPPQIFDLFVQGQRTSERAQGGLGIGLALVRILVELHGGRVEARSDGQGRGSEFVIELPAAQGAIVAHPVPGTALASQQPRLDSRILLVDDNVDAATVLAEALRVLGHEVLVAHDGPQALVAAESFRATTALLDIGLPVMDGYELARLLRELWKGRSVQFVALTGYGQESDKEHSKAAGFDAHLVKPIDLAELAALLQPRATGAA